MTEETGQAAAPDTRSVKDKVTSSLEQLENHIKVLYGGIHHELEVFFADLKEHLTGARPKTDTEKAQEAADAGDKTE